MTIIFTRTAYAYNVLGMDTVFILVEMNECVGVGYYGTDVQL